MTENELIAFLQPHYRDILGTPDLVLTRSLSANDVESWDSLNHILLIVKCQELFDITFTADELVSLQNFGEFIDLMLPKL